MPEHAGKPENRGPLSWSADGQTPEFLAATRMVSLDDAIVARVLESLQIESGMRVLDVGCGSGEYCFRLGSTVRGVQFTGLEYDAAFVAFANERAAGNVGYPFEEPNPENEYRFVGGDGLHLPFDDGAFDAVISHTYLTAVPDWASALAEMCRVCKPGGTVSSVTSMTDDFYGTGSIGLFSRLFDPESAELLRLVGKAKAKAFPAMDLASGIAPRKAPVAFDWIGLRNVRCTPLAHYFCLSDSSIAPERKRRYVDLLFAMEREQLARLKGHAEARALLSDEQWQAYERLLDTRCDELAHAANDREWNWYGNASLLVRGTVPAEGPGPRCASLRAESRAARSALGACAEAGFSPSTSTRQLGPGRCVLTELTARGLPPLSVCGFTPPQAIVEGCGKLAAQALVNGSVLTGCLREWGERERLLEAAEARACESRLDGHSLPALSNSVLFQHAELWETVADAALSGMRVQFKDAGVADGRALVWCEAECGGRRSSSIAAHDTSAQAAMRAFARCIGAWADSRG